MIHKLHLDKESIICGFILGILNGIGFQLKHYGQIYVNLQTAFVFCCSIGIFVLLTGAVFNLFFLISTREYYDVSQYIKSSKKYVGFLFLLLIFAWIPSYLGVFPGLFNYDAYEQLEQVMSSTITEKHTVLHTLLMGKIILAGFKYLGSLNAGVLMYFCFQLTLFALLICIFFYILYIMKAPMFIHLLSFVLFTLYPPLVINLLSITKDNYFTLLLVDFIIVNYALFFLEDIKYKKTIAFLWIFTGFGTLIFRNNAVYAFLVFLPIIAWVIIKNKKRKGVWGLLLCLLILFVCYKYPFTKAVTTSGIDSREMMSVPAQQIARTYVNHYDELLEEERRDIEVLYSYADLKYYYIAEISDIIKACLNMDLLHAESEKYMDLYIKLFMRYPMEYVNSFLANTYGFWYMWPDLVLTWKGEMGYLRVDSYDIVPMEPKLPVITRFYKLFENSKLVSGDFWGSLIFMPATYFYFVLLHFFYGIREKNKKMILINLFIIILWATYLLGPVVLVRYVMFLFLMVPLNLLMLCQNIKNTNEYTFGEIN